MPQSIEEKSDRFKRMFPPRVRTLVKTLKLLGNCTDKSNYHRDEDLVKRCWIEIARKLEDTAALYEIDFQVTLNGEPVAFIDTSEPLS